MKHLKRYNEEANPIEWVKGKIKSNKANKSLSKGIDKVKKMMSEVKIPNAEISELDQSNWSVGKSVDSKPVYVSFNVTTKTNNNIHTNLEFNLLSYLNDDGNLRAWSEEGEMKLVCDNIIFQKIVKFEKKAGYYSSYNGYKNFYDNDLGRIDMGEDYISIANQGGHGNLDDVENYGLVNSSKEIKDFISKLISNLPKIYEQTIESIKNKKSQIDDSKRKEKEHEQRVNDFKSKQEHIKDCFLDLIDISDDHHFDVNDYGHVNLSLKLKNIKVVSQSKEAGSRYRGSDTVHFREAKFEITDELFDIFDLIKDAKSQLMSVDERIKMRTTFRDDHLSITIWVSKE